MVCVIDNPDTQGCLVVEAGQALFDYAVRAGFGQHGHLHAVGDGADWVAR